MDMLRSQAIPSAQLPDWRKLAQGLHARYLVEDFARAATFVSAIASAVTVTAHQPRVRIGDGHVDLEVVSADAIYRTDDGEEFVVEWVTQRDVDLARSISKIAAQHHLRADPRAVSEVEFGLDTADAGRIAPVWAMVLTGDPRAQGRGTPGEEIRDETARVPNLWFGDDPGQVRPRFHVEVYVPAEVVQERIAEAVAAGADVVDGSQSPGMTVLADQDGNHAVICADVAAADAVD